MTDPSWPSQIDLASYVSDVKTDQLKLRVPVPIIVLAAELLEGIPRRVGVKGASELVAALLVRAMNDAAMLDEFVGDYRETRVHAVLRTNETEGLHEVPARADIELG